jgi:hypothetical protein
MSLENKTEEYEYADDENGVLGLELDVYLSVVKILDSQFVRKQQ